MYWTSRNYSITLECSAMDLRGAAKSQSETCDLHPSRDEAFAGSYTRLLMGELLDPSELSKEFYGYEHEKLLIDEVSGLGAVSKEAIKEETRLNGKARGSRGLSEVDRKKGFALHVKPSSLIHKSTPSSESSTFVAKSYQSMRIYSLEIPVGKFVVEFMTRFARTNSRPGVALSIMGGSGTVCNLELQGPWENDLRVAGNAEIVTISKTFQADWWGSTKGTSVAIMVATNSGELCGGTVKGDMQAVRPVVLNVYLFS